MTSSITLTTEAQTTPSGSDTTETDLCRHIDARGHRCRMLVMRPDETLCAHHAQRRLQAQSGNEAAVTENCSPVPRILMTPSPLIAFSQLSSGKSR